jgi:hypothetical protein
MTTLAEALQDLLGIDPTLANAPRPKSLKGLRTKKLTPQQLKAVWVLGLAVDAQGLNDRIVSQKFDPKTGITKYTFENDL